MNDNYLSDELWRAVASVLPGKEGDPGCKARDNRLFLEAVFWTLRTNSPWRSLPPRFGKWYTAYTRYRRWERTGVWRRVVAALGEEGVCDFKVEEGGLRFAPLGGKSSCARAPEEAGDIDESAMA